MVGARFRWNKAKPRRRLLLIRAWGGERFGAAGSRRGWRPATRAAPSSGTAHSLATAMPGAAVDAGCGSVYGAVGPELRFGAAELGRRRISRPPDASVSRGGGVWERLRCGCRWHRECCGWCAAMRTAAWLWAARAVLCCSAAQGLRALGRFGAGRRHRDCGR